MIRQMRSSGQTPSDPGLDTTSRIRPTVENQCRRKEGKAMAAATGVKKTVVGATLRSRDLHGRANWVEKELPPLIDTARNASLL